MRGKIVKQPGRLFRPYGLTLLILLHVYGLYHGHIVPGRVAGYYRSDTVQSNTIKGLILRKKQHLCTRISVNREIAASVKLLITNHHQIAAMR